MGSICVRGCDKQFLLPPHVGTRFPDRRSTVFLGFTSGSFSSKIQPEDPGWDVAWLGGLEITRCFSSDHIFGLHAPRYSLSSEVHAFRPDSSRTSMNPVSERSTLHLTHRTRKLYAAMVLGVRHGRRKLRLRPLLRSATVGPRLARRQVQW